VAPELGRLFGRFTTGVLLTGDGLVPVERGRLTTCPLRGRVRVVTGRLIVLFTQLPELGE